MYIPIADAHGLVDKEILRLVYSLFNIFVIHSFSGDKDREVLKNEVEEIQKIIDNPLIFII
jgi:hypothetical protein